MATEIICAGFGGQGVLTAGMLLINAGMEQGKNVLFYPSYGSEMRGGPANCAVKISETPEEQIASPVCKHPDIVLTMNGPAIDKFEGRLKPGGLLLVNSSIVPDDRTYRDDIKVVKVAATDIAKELENPRGANIVMLGALASNSDVFTAEYLREAIDSFFAKKGKNNPKNAQCFEKGAEVK